MKSEYKAGDKLCSCTLLQYCGDGGFGEVWLAEDAIGAKVALKILRGKYSEKEIAGLKHYKDCNHPNLLKIRHVEISENLICYTMDAADDLNGGTGEYLPDTLANRLNKSGRLDGKEISEMLDGLLGGLEELHSRGLVHRDIKPDNILWVNNRATLSDAGLVAPIGKHTLVGTPGFVSPRMLETGGSAEVGDDFYALSKVVYCALTGLAPNEYPAIPQEMTISLDPKINRAILAGCSQNIKSSAEFRKVIAENSNPVPQEQKTEPQVTIMEVRKSSFPWSVAIIAVMLAAIAGFYLLSGRNTAAPVNNEQRNTGSTVPQQVTGNNKKETVPEPEKSTGNINVKNHETPSGNKKTIPEPKNSAVDNNAKKHETPSGNKHPIPKPENSAINRNAKKHETPSGNKKTIPEPENSAINSNVAKQETPSSNTYPIPDPEIESSAVAEFEARFAISRDVDLQEWFYKLSFFDGRYTPPNIETKMLRDYKMKVQELFRRTGLYSEKYLDDLLNRQIFSFQTIKNQLSILQEKHYIGKIADQLFRMEMRLRILSPGDANISRQLKERQQYWKTQEGSKKDIISRMLKEDPVMQMAAVNMLIERFSRQVMLDFEYIGKYDRIIPGLVALQNEFITISYRMKHR